MTEGAIVGSCVCGAVRYAIEPPFLGFQYCHCSRCRKATGSAHGSNIFVARDRFRWEQGEDRVQCFELPEAKYWCHGFCDRCGSSLPWPTKTGKAFVVPAGTLDTDPEITPSKSIYWASRAPWYVSTNEHDTFDEGPPRK